MWNMCKEQIEVQLLMEERLGGNYGIYNIAFR